MTKKKNITIQPYNEGTAKSADLLIGAIKSLFRNIVSEEFEARNVGNAGVAATGSPVAHLTLSDDALIGEDLMIAYRIVQAICAKLIDPKRVSMRDNQAYKAIVLDNNNRKTIVRFVFGKALKQVHLIHGEKNAVKKKVKIDDLTGIYGCTKDIEARIKELSQIK